MAFVGQCQASRMPRKQFASGKCLKLGDCFSDCRRRDGHDRGGEAHFSAFGCRYKVANLSQGYGGHKFFGVEFPRLSNSLRLHVVPHQLEGCSPARIISHAFGYSKFTLSNCNVYAPCNQSHSNKAVIFRLASRPAKKRTKGKGKCQHEARQASAF